MTNRPATFKQADLTKALKGALAAGLKPSRVEIEPGSGRIVILMPGETRAADPYDAWKAGRDAS